ncbi:hypothetical protein MTR_7g114800 [Medicago truncatula]|uniref:Uncharacterized protein n=1 Tax=Medicago truncatula TaxID=3880 RepID=G7L1T4_MEDTR|nr:hypothetical protein MTR_7g114800 [Medicago truncatula]
MLNELKERLIQTKNRIRKKSNKHRLEVEFHVGNIVLKIKPYKIKTLAKKVN